MNYLEYTLVPAYWWGGDLYQKAKDKILNWRSSSDESTEPTKPALNVWGNSSQTLIANALKYGFKSIDEVRAFQKANNLGSDGKIDNNGKVMKFLEANPNLLPSNKKNKSTSTGSQESTHNGLTFVKNLVKNPASALIDGLLYTADVVGLPSNATNFLRDENVALGYRAKAALSSTPSYLISKAKGEDVSFSDVYKNTLANPNLWMRATTINPLTNTNSNYSKEELEVLQKASKNGTKNVTNDVIRSYAGSYGGRGGIWGYLTDPTKVLATSLGRMSFKNGKGTDVFDVNTQGREALRDNENYLSIAKQNLQDGNYTDYTNLRAVLPYIGSIDIIPDQFKINTNINF